VRRLMAPLIVEPAGASVPRRLRWVDPKGGGETTALVARVLDDWDYAGRWWEVETLRHYLLLETVEGHTLEVFREGEGWCLSRLSD
jgi:hypothetical protein